MDFTGIIAEYDPFHNGHAAQLAAVRAAGAQCIAVCMSSGAVQRGGVPILPESVRVRAALDAGADLVVALPAPYACATAEQFAAAGVHLLAALGCDTLAFGAETPDAAALLDTARLLDGEELNARIRQNLATGMTYAAARAAAADALHPRHRRPAAHAQQHFGHRVLQGDPAPARGPDAAGTAAAWRGARRRAGAHAGTPMASASFLRGLPQPDWEPLCPPRAAELYSRAAADGLLLDGARLETAVLALLRMQDPANFAQVRGVSEGLENRLTAAVREADSLDDLYTRLKTKRYPHARLRRLVLDAALGFPAALPMPPYLHVLGARKAALPRLKQASLPAATALADLARTGPEAAKISRLHNKAVDFSSLCREKIQPMGLAFTAKPVVI